MRPGTITVSTFVRLRERAVADDRTSRRCDLRLSSQPIVSILCQRSRTARTRVPISARNTWLSTIASCARDLFLSVSLEYVRDVMNMREKISQTETLRSPLVKSGF